MKPLRWLSQFLILALALAGCESASPTGQRTLVEQLITPTLISRPSTPIPPKTPVPLHTVNQLPAPSIAATTIPRLSTVTPMPIATLEPEKAKETITTSFREPIDCSAPCFWGILPGQTTLDEAGEIFSHLGLYMASTTAEGKDFAGTGYNFDSGLSARIILTINKNIVENLRLKIRTEKQTAGMAREWSAYSPETLIQRYGMPSRVDFIADWGPGPFFSMQMYFDALDLIVQYAGPDVIPARKGSSRVCPLTVQFEAVWLWMGENPVYPPGEGVPLEEATSMTMEEFSELMTGEPNAACFTFNGDVFE